MRQLKRSGNIGLSGIKTVMVFLLLVMPAFAQQEAAQPGPARPIGAAAAFPDRTDRNITLDVVVTDKSGKAVAGLQQQDFMVLDDKLAQNLKSFRAVEAGSSAPPVSVILLVDAVNTSFQSVAYGRGQIESFLKQNGGKLAEPVTMVFFTDKDARVQRESTRDGNALAASLDEYATSLRTITRSQGFYGAEDRLRLSIQTLGMLVAAEAKVPGRKLLVWISPGWPLLSGPGIQLSQKNEEGLFHSIVDLSTAMRQANVTLYSVDPLGTADAGGTRTSYYKEFTKGVKAAKNVEIGNLGLQVLAYQSGGRVFNSSNDIAGEIASAATDANAYYVLSFDAPPPDGPVQYHALEVKLDKPGLTARTRTGYYALK
jgi:VWFA-related protein